MRLVISLVVSFTSLLFFNFAQAEDVGQDPPKTLLSASVNHLVIQEGEKSQITISRSNNFGKALAVHFHIAGSAKLNRDYRLKDNHSTMRGRYPNYRVAIPAHEESVIININALRDDLGELSEQAEITITEKDTYLIDQEDALTVVQIDNNVAVTEGNYDIIVVAGQSNAQGAGSPDQVFSDSWQHSSVDSRIKQIGRGRRGDMEVIGVGNTENGQTWDALMHWGRDLRTQKYLGFALPFARGYTKIFLETGRKVLIIPAACGATRISDWQGSTVPVSSECSGKDLYEDMERRIDAALNLPGNNRVVAFLWHQGEADIRKISQQFLSPEEYLTSLDDFHHRVRDDYGYDFPVISAGYSDHWNDYNGLNVQDARVELEAKLKNYYKNKPGYSFASTARLETRSDQVHFTAQSLIYLGRRMFKAFRTEH